MKAELKMHCESLVDNRIKRIQDQMESISQSLQSETKSTAGDKHETGRAMLQLEREKLGQQLLEVEKMQAVLKRIDSSKPLEVVALGSFVKTYKRSYYIAISAGKYDSLDETVYCISVQTPMARVLLGKSVGESIAYNNERQKILKIS